MSGFESPEKLETMEYQMKRTRTANKEPKSGDSVHSSNEPKMSENREQSDIVKLQTKSETEPEMKGQRIDEKVPPHQLMCYLCLIVA